MLAGEAVKDLVAEDANLSRRELGTDSRMTPFTSTSQSG